MTVNVSEFVRRSAQARPEGVALACEDTSITWSGLDSLVDEIASAFSALGLVAGHRVAFCTGNSIEAVATYFAIARGGFVAVPVNPSVSEADVSLILEETTPRVIVADTSGIDLVRGRAGEATIIAVSRSAQAGELTFEEFTGRGSGLVPPFPNDPEALALIAYTNDALGRPRGAMLTHRALISNVEQVAGLDVPLIFEDDRVLGVLPVCHIFGLNAILGQAVFKGAMTILIPRFEPAAVLDVIVERGVTVVPVAPPVIAAWIGFDGLADKFGAVRAVLSGAAVLDPELEVEFEVSAGVAVDQGYGMTEAGPVVATTIGSQRFDGPPQRGAVGTALPGVEVRAVEDGEDADPGDAAELWIRGDNLFSGYWPDGSDGPDENGWYHSGDIGFVDPDGAIVVVERLNELVTVSGFTVYPFEVEDILSEAPGVAAVAVVGVPHQGTDEAVRAFVVPEPDADQATLGETVSEFAAGRLAAYKVPAEVIVVQNLPYSRTGKIEKSRLRAMARGRELGLS